jgi:hypothetical protein
MGGAGAGRGKLTVELEFQVIPAIRHSQIYPAQHSGRATAAPEFLEAENTVVKCRRPFEIGYQNPDMHDVIGDSGWRHEFPRLPRGPSIGTIFDDFNHDCRDP